MSFAPSKKNSQRDSYDPHKSRYTSHDSPAQAFSQMRTRESAESDLSYRVDVLTSNMVRINQQQEALLPVFDMADISPGIEKSEELAKSIQERNRACEQRLNRLEDLLRSFQGRMETTIPRSSTVEPKYPKPDLSHIERNIKSVVTSIGERDDTLFGLKANWTKFQKAVDKRAETQCSEKENNSEKKIELYSTAFNTTTNDIHSGVNVGFERLEEAVNDLYNKVEGFKTFSKVNNQEDLADDIRELIAKRFHKHFELFKDKYNKDIQRLFREFGVLRIEMDMMSEDKRQAKIQPYIQSTPDELTPSEKKVKFNNVEQAVFIYNTGKKLDKLKAKHHEYKRKSESRSVNHLDSKEEWNKLIDEIEIVGETYTSLKYQIEGAKKKCFFDMKKIEEKMESVLQIKKQVQEELRSDPKQAKVISMELQVIEDFPNQIKTLMDDINMNLTTAFTRLEMVEEKIQENQELLLKRVISSVEREKNE